MTEYRRIGNNVNIIIKKSAMEPEYMTNEFRAEDRRQAIEIGRLMLSWGGSLAAVAGLIKWAFVFLDKPNFWLPVHPFILTMGGVVCIGLSKLHLQAVKK